MHIILLVLCISFSLCESRRPGTGVLDHDIHIKEGEARFFQRIKSSLYDNTVLYQNPNHNNVTGSHTLQDFSQGKQISCWPNLKQCFLSAIDRSLYPDPGSTITNIGHMWANGIDSINERETQKTVYHFIINGAEISNLVSLGSHLRDFVTQFGYPLYPISLLPKDTKFITGSFNPSIHKRQLVNVRQCNDGSFPVPTYGWTDGHCDYLHVCKSNGAVHGHNTFDCGNHHVYGVKAFNCFCCPGETTLHECTACKETRMVG